MCKHSCHPQMTHDPFYSITLLLRMWQHYYQWLQDTTSCQFGCIIITSTLVRAATCVRLPDCAQTATVLVRAPGHLRFIPVLPPVAIARYIGAFGVLHLSTLRDTLHLLLHDPLSRWLAQLATRPCGEGGHGPYVHGQLHGP